MAGSFSLIQAQNTQTNSPGTYNGHDGNNTNNQKTPSNQTVSPTYTGTTNDGMYNGDKTYQDSTKKKTGSTKDPNNKTKNSTNNKPNNSGKNENLNDGTKGSKHKSSRDTSSHK